MLQPTYEMLDHTADLELRLRAPDFGLLCATAAEALAPELGLEKKTDEEEELGQIHAKGPTPELGLEKKTDEEEELGQIHAKGPTPELGLEKKTDEEEELGQIHAKGPTPELGLEKKTDGEEVSFSLSAPDEAALLVDFINELIYYADAKSLVLHDVTARQTEGTTLLVHCRASRTARPPRVKAATLHGLTIEHEPSGMLSARVILDM